VPLDDHSMTILAPTVRRVMRHAPVMSVKLVLVTGDCLLQ
jgi:hypothetical protein